jgi:hypothetical protein
VRLCDGGALRLFVVVFSPPRFPPLSRGLFFGQLSEETPHAAGLASATPIAPSGSGWKRLMPAPSIRFNSAISLFREP